jgi:hypothetical protein
MANLDTRSLAFRQYHLKYHLIQLWLSSMVEASYGVSATHRKCPELPGVAAAVAVMIQGL